VNPKPGTAIVCISARGTPVCSLSSWAAYASDGASVVAIESPTISERIGAAALGARRRRNRCVDCAGRVVASGHDFGTVVEVVVLLLVLVDAVTAGARVDDVARGDASSVALHATSTSATITAHAPFLTGAGP
jgi:hypothetical protein